MRSAHGKTALSKRKAPSSPAESKELVLKVRPVSQIHRHLACLFYGRSGTGKTTLACSFPTPILYIDIRDQGTDSVSDYGDEVQVMEPKTWDEFEIAYWWLLKHPDVYKTVVIDTITQLQLLSIKKILEDNDKDSRKAGEWGVMTKREWGQVASHMKEWITNFRDLAMSKNGMEIVFLAQDRVSENESEDPEVMLDPEIGPRLSPSIAAHINAEVSVIGNTFIRRKTTVKKVGAKKKEVHRTQYCLRLGPDPVYVTKARKPKKFKLPPLIVNPSYDAIVAVLKGERNGEEEE